MTALAERYNRDYQIAWQCLGGLIITLHTLFPCTDIRATIQVLAAADHRTSANPSSDVVRHALYGLLCGLQRTLLAEAVSTALRQWAEDDGAWLTVGSTSA